VNHASLHGVWWNAGEHYTFLIILKAITLKFRPVRLRAYCSR